MAASEVDNLSSFEAPEHLLPVARDEWRRTVPLLAELGLLHKADLGTLELYCCARADFVEANGKLAAEGLTSKDDHGVWRRNPYLLIRNKSLEQLIRLAQELGLSRAARSRQMPTPASNFTSGSNLTPDGLPTREELLAYDRGEHLSLDAFLRCKPAKPGDHEREAHFAALRARRDDD